MFGLNRRNGIFMIIININNNIIIVHARFSVNVRQQRAALWL